MAPRRVFDLLRRGVRPAGQGAAQGVPRRRGGGHQTRLLLHSSLRSGRGFCPRLLQRRQRRAHRHSRQLREASSQQQLRRGWERRYGGEGHARVSVACQMQSVVQKESEPAREMKRREGAGQKPRNDPTNFQVVCMPLLRERGEKEKKSRCLLLGSPHRLSDCPWRYAPWRLQREAHLM